MKEVQKRIEFKNKILELKSRYFPNCDFEVLKERLNFLKIRIKFGDTAYLYIYYNSSNDRNDFALIIEGRRVFGYDNLGVWHKHPVENPEMHKPCEEPSLDEINPLHQPP